MEAEHKGGTATGWGIGGGGGEVDVVIAHRIVSQDSESSDTGQHGGIYSVGEGTDSGVRFAEAGVQSIG